MIPIFFAFISYSIFNEIYAYICILRLNLKYYSILPIKPSHLHVFRTITSYIYHIFKCFIYQISKNLCSNITWNIYIIFNNAFIHFHFSLSLHLFGNTIDIPFKLQLWKYQIMSLYIDSTWNTSHFIVVAEFVNKKLWAYLTEHTDYYFVNIFLKYLSYLDDGYSVYNFEIQLFE